MKTENLQQLEIKWEWNIYTYTHTIYTYGAIRMCMQHAYCMAQHDCIVQHDFAFLHDEPDI